MRKLLPAALTILAGAFSAQAGTYYMTDGVSGFIIDLSAQSVAQFAVAPNEFAIAVADTIRIASFDGSEATEYSSSGSRQLFSGGSSGSFQLLDGTTDGTTNYAIDFLGGGVYAADRDWQNLRLLVAPDPDNVVNLFGITYDPITRSLFVSQGNGIIQYSTSGVFMTSFPVSVGDNAIALAFDQGTDSLWYYDQNFTAAGRFVNIDRTGAVLRQVIVPDFFNPFAFGGEMGSAVPEPGAWLLGLTGFGGLALRRRKRSR